MKTRTPEETLKEFKQLNKVAREKRAVKMGFANAAAYLSHLEVQASAKKSTITNYPKKPKSVAKVAPKKESPKKVKATPPAGVETLIHVADVLDASGSMNGPKFNNALYGINKGVQGLREDTSGAIYTYTLCDFSNDIRFPAVKEQLGAIGTIVGETRGSTALYDAIGQTIRKVQDGIAPGAKVLVNIYTDGQENASREFKEREIAAMIKVLSGQGWTFTFIGTDHDVSYVTRNLHIDKSNTLVYDGSAQGLEKSFNATLTARSSYAQKAVAGEDVSTGFYKDLSNKQ